jgi:cellulose synthase/poly-beta-1,6-N-acetylglucosamine synthase-like glycosyltransferase
MFGASEVEAALQRGRSAYNERPTSALLDALLNQHLHDTEIPGSYRLASGCTDNTVPIIERVAVENPSIKLIVQPKREGKTAAINLFLANAREQICVLESGDTLPAENSVEHMVRMFADPTVGMVAPRSPSTRPIT